MKAHWSRIVAPLITFLAVSTITLSAQNVGSSSEVFAATGTGGQYPLAASYEHDGIPGHLAEAQKLYQIAADKGDARAEYELGVIRLYGGHDIFRAFPYLVTVPAVLEEGDAIDGGDAAFAVRYFNKAAEQGLPEAEYCLGLMLSKGKGVPQNAALSKQWFDRLRSEAEKGVAEAQFYVGQMYYWKEGGVSTADTRIDAISWLRKASDQGLPAAQYMLARIFCNGDGIEADYTEYLKLLKSAAEKGVDAAQYEVGEQYFYGFRAVHKDAFEGIKWLRRAAEQGELHAASELYTIYSIGEGGVPKNETEAAKWKDLADQLNAMISRSLRPGRVRSIPDSR